MTQPKRGAVKRWSGVMQGGFGALHLNMRARRGEPNTEWPLPKWAQGKWLHVVITPITRKVKGKGGKRGS